MQRPAAYYHFESFSRSLVRVFRRDRISAAGYRRFVLSVLFLLIHIRGCLLFAKRQLRLVRLRVRRSRFSFCSVCRLLRRCSFGFLINFCLYRQGHSVQELSLPYLLRGLQAQSFPVLQVPVRAPPQSSLPQPSHPQPARPYQPWILWR